MSDKAKGLVAPSARSLLRRYAQECRTLAMECVDGTAPPFITDSFEEPHGRCAIGWVLHRLNPGERAWTTFWRVYDAMPPRKLTPLGLSPDGAVIEANNKWPAAERHGAVVSPLLWLADAIDAMAREGNAAEGRPQSTSISSPPSPIPRIA